MMTRLIARFTLPLLALMLAASNVTLAAQAAQTPTQVYTAYRAAFDKATRSDDIKPFQSRKVRGEMDAMKPADREQFFKMIKGMGTMASVKVTKETLTPGDGAILMVDAVNPGKVNMTCEVTMVKEDGAWKIATENWAQK
jgi:hypothetical protein